MRPSAMLNQDVFTSAEGDCVVQWPDGLAVDEIDEFEEWLDLVKKKIRRIVTARAARKAPEVDKAEVTATPEGRG